MAQDNNVTITGNATREPELRYTPSGQAVASFGVAVNRRWQSNGEWQEQVSFFDVTCWSRLAENVSESVAKGTRVTVTGRLDQRAWESPEGEKKTKVEIVADDVAASLRFATVEITRNEREDGPSGGGRTAAPAHDPNEEPFAREAFDVELWPGERHRTGLNKWAVS